MKEKDEPVIHNPVFEENDYGGEPAQEKSGLKPVNLNLQQPSTAPSTAKLAPEDFEGDQTILQSFRDFFNNIQNGILFPIQNGNSSGKKDGYNTVQGLLRDLFGSWALIIYDHPVIIVVCTLLSVAGM